MSVTDVILSFNLSHLSESFLCDNGLILKYLFWRDLSNNSFDDESGFPLWLLNLKNLTTLYVLSFALVFTLELSMYVVSALQYNFLFCWLADEWRIWTFVEKFQFLYLALPNYKMCELPVSMINLTVSTFSGVVTYSQLLY